MQIQLEPERIKKRVVARNGQENFNLLLTDIVLFFSENKVVYLIDKEGRKLMTYYNLIDLESKLDPAIFFRANRQYIININFIRSFKTYERTKIVLDLLLSQPEHKIIISQETARDFRRWINEA